MKILANDVVVKVRSVVHACGAFNTYKLTSLIGEVSPFS